MLPPLSSFYKRSGGGGACSALVKCECRRRSCCLRPRIHLQPLLLVIRRSAAVINPDPSGEQPCSATVPVCRASESHHQIVLPLFPIRPSQPLTHLPTHRPAINRFTTNGTSSPSGTLSDFCLSRSPSVLRVKVTNVMKTGLNMLCRGMFLLLWKLVPNRQCMSYSCISIVSQWCYLW